MKEQEVLVKIETSKLRSHTEDKIVDDLLSRLDCIIDKRELQNRDEYIITINSTREETAVYLGGYLTTVMNVFNHHLYGKEEVTAVNVIADFKVVNSEIL